MSVMKTDFKYDAFISYRHTLPDTKVAEHVHRLTETYHIPGKYSRDGFPRSAKRVFRDRDELPTSSSLKNNIEEALQQSRYLIVICSRNTPASQWVSKEVETFIRLGRGSRIIALLIDGSPEDSFPGPLLDYLSSADESPGSGVFLDLRAKNINMMRKVIKKEKLKLISAILDLDYSKLKNLDFKRSIFRNCLAGFLVFSLISAFGAYSFVQWQKVKKANEQIEKQTAIFREKKERTKKEMDRVIMSTELVITRLPSRLGGIKDAAPIVSKILIERNEILDRILELEPDSLNGLRKKAQNYMQLGMHLETLGYDMEAAKYFMEAAPSYVKLIEVMQKARMLWGTKQEHLLDMTEEEKATLGFIDLDRVKLMSIYEKLGDASYRKGNLKDAEKYYKEGLAICNEIEKPGKSEKEGGLVITTDSNIAQMNYYRKTGCFLKEVGDMENAKDCFEETLSFSTVLLKAYDKPDQRQLAIDHYNVGSVSLLLGDLDAAKEYFEKSLSLFNEYALGNTDKQAQKDLAIALYNMGYAFSLSGDKKGADKYFSESDRLMDSLGEKRLEH